MRFIIECEDPMDIILGYRSIKNCMEAGVNLSISSFDNGSTFLVRKTKTGYSARESKT